MEYSSAIKIIRDSGKILNLTLARQKDTLSQERLAEFILNDLIWFQHIFDVNKFLSSYCSNFGMKYFKLTLNFSKTKKTRIGIFG